MEELKDLVYLLDRYAVRDINVITNPNKKVNKENDRYWDFYVGIQKNKWDTEEEIAIYFGYKTKSDKGFRRLKEGLKERLLNCTFFIDLYTSEFSDYDRKCQESYRLALIAEWLQRRGANDIYFDIASKALSLAVEVRHPFLIVQVSAHLRGVYALYPKYSKEFESVSKLFHQYKSILDWELSAQTDYLRVISTLNNRKGYKKEFAPVAAELFSKYKDEILEEKSYMFQIYARTIGLYAIVLLHNWQKGLEFCEETIRFLEKYDEMSKKHIIIFKTHKSTCLLMLGRYEEAFLDLEANVGIKQEGKIFWFKNREIAAITSLYAEKYQQAWDLVQMATKHDRFSTISEVDQETWRLYEGYLQLICRINKEEYWSKDDSAASKFRLNRLLNEMPLYSQDKRGGNIPMLILQILFYVTELSENKKAFDEITNRVEALRKYNDRNLDPDEEHVRSDCFISLLTLLPKFIYKPLDLAKAAHPLLAKMKGYQTDIIDNSFEVEVVPYERQWEWIMRYVNELSEKK